VASNAGPLRVVFLGTGTSTGVPVPGCDCPVCTSQDARNKRLRVAILLSWDGRCVVVDTGPDFRQQMITQRVRLIDGVLFTHYHADHLHGLDDIRTYCHRALRPIPLYGERPTLERIRRLFDYAFEDPAEGGGVPRVELHEVTGPFLLFGREVQPLRVWHGRTPVLAYRLGNFAYSTDCSDIPPETMEQLQGLDVLVLDALRPRPHSTHFSISEAVAVAEKLRPKRTYFVHMTHDVDHAAVNAQLPPGIALAYDGLEIRV
jgi:phosphoribosyl 1,2-cyclic phosphate phosphodiesterase